MRCEILGYAGCNEPRFFVGPMLAARGGRRKAMLHLCSSSWGLGVPGSADGCARGSSGTSDTEGPWLQDFPPGKGSPAQPWVLSTPPASLSAAGFVARPSRSEFGWAYFKNPKMFSLKMKL